jgi:hypothetical protein
MSDELAKPPTSQLTTARLSLGNTSPTVSTRDHLAFQLDHAMARDAVLATLDVRPFLDGLRARGLEPLMLHSAAADRKTYLRRPDLGRTLSSDSIAALHSLNGARRLCGRGGETCSSVQTPHRCHPRRWAFCARPRTPRPPTARRNPSPHP